MSRVHDNEEILSFFEYEHLSEALQAISKPFRDLAREIYMRDVLGSSLETGAAIRKLLEAKDCAVRAALTFEVNE